MVATALSACGAGQMTPSTADVGTACIVVVNPAVPAVQASRGDCGPSPPADLSLVNGASDATEPCPNPAPAGPSILWCSSPNDIWATDLPTQGWACSPRTRLMHWDGAAWTMMTQRDDYFFESAWGRNAGDVWITGHAGSVSWFHQLVALHWDGTRLQQLLITDPGTSNDPAFQVWQAAVFGTADGKIWIRADGGDGSTWIGGDRSWRIPTPLAASCLMDSSI